MKNPFDELKKTRATLHRAHGKPGREPVTDDFDGTRTPIIVFDYDRLGLLAPLVNDTLRPILESVDGCGTAYVHNHRSPDLVGFNPGGNINSQYQRDLYDLHTKIFDENRAWDKYALAVRNEIKTWAQDLEPSDLPPIRLLSIEMWDGGPDQHEIGEWLEVHRDEVIESAVMADCHVNLDHLIGEACTALGWHSVPDSAHMEFNFDWID